MFKTINQFFLAAAFIIFSEPVLANTCQALIGLEHTGVAPCSDFVNFKIKEPTASSAIQGGFDLPWGLLKNLDPLRSGNASLICFSTKYDLSWKPSRQGLVELTLEARAITDFPEVYKTQFRIHWPTKTLLQAKKRWGVFLPVRKDFSCSKFVDTPPMNHLPW